MVSVIIAAAGIGSRMGSMQNKLFIPLFHVPILYITVEKFISNPRINEIIICANKNDIRTIQTIFRNNKEKIKIVQGGPERQQSIYNALKKLDSKCKYVMIHDGARPLVKKTTIETVLNEIKDKKAVIVGVPLKDTLKEIDDNNCVINTLSREKFYCIQTPQAFKRSTIMKAHKKAVKENLLFTDDAALVENLKEKVKVIPGSYENIKITTPEDIIFARAIINKRKKQRESTEIYPRTGLGYDVHQLIEKRKLIIGGVAIPFEKGLLGHSDADVLIHAIIDALLGASGLGDIGRYFPDNDNYYKNISSILLLEQVIHLLIQKEYSIINIDATITAQEPKMSPYINQMKTTIAYACNMLEKNINIKATTTERLGFVGRKEGIEAYAIVNVVKTNFLNFRL